MDRTRNKMMFFLAFVLLLIVFSLIAPLIVPNDPNTTNVMIAKQPPSSAYPFGTDAFGRCVFSRVLYGARTSIFTALALVGITAVFGTVVGMLCGYFGGAIDTVIMRIVDILLAFPNLILAIAVAGIMGGGLINAMIALFITGWTSYARLARSHVFAIKKEEFISASRLSGAGKTSVMFRHLLPNIMAPLIVNATVQISSMMMGVAGLSFLGIGVTEPNAEWGSMINQARGLLQLAPWTILAPAGAIIITIMIFNLLGDTVSDYLDPKRK